MKPTLLLIPSLLCLPLFGGPPARNSGDSTPAPRAFGYELTWFTVDGGGGMFATGQGFELTGTIGQPDANVTPMTGSEFVLRGGFLSELPACPNACGDIHPDGVIDLVDFALFAQCFGLREYSSIDCACSDLNQDGSIDLQDFATLSLLFGGSAEPGPPPNCP